MTALERWLEIATRKLAEESVAKVRREIEEHFTAAITSGVTQEVAVAALGEAKAANRGYRKVLLTIGEARMLHLMRSEIPPGLTPGRVTLGKLLAGILFVEAMGGMLAGMIHDAGWRYFGVMLIVLMSLQSLLPLWTVKRARIFRWAKWLMLLVASVPLFEACWWAPIGVFVVILYGDYRKMVVRRKVPTEQWPKKLYV